MPHAVSSLHCARRRAAGRAGPGGAWADRRRRDAPIGCAGGGGGEGGGRRLWDFPDATTIEQATGDSIEGTFYAPNADFIDTDPANVEGDIVVRELHHGPQAAPAVWTRSDKPTRPSDR